MTHLAPTRAAIAIRGSSDEGALREIGLNKSDVALTAIGDDIEARLLTTMNLRLPGIETIRVKAATKTHHRILSRLGADRVILPEQDIGRPGAQMLNNPAVQDEARLGNRFSVAGMVMPYGKTGRTPGQAEPGRAVRPACPRPDARHPIPVLRHPRDRPAQGRKSS